VSEKPFRRGDIIWLDFGDPVGHEQGGRRPAVVVSPESYNARSTFTLVCPVTSNPKRWPFKAPLPGDCAVQGFVLVDQVRCVDTAARFARPGGTVDAETLEIITEKLQIALGALHD
jgi:mRNA interferase MazF